MHHRGKGVGTRVYEFLIFDPFFIMMVFIISQFRKHMEIIKSCKSIKKFEENVGVKKIACQAGATVYVWILFLWRKVKEK